MGPEPDLKHVKRGRRGPVVRKKTMICFPVHFPLKLRLLLNIRVASQNLEVKFA